MITIDPIMAAVVVVGVFIYSFYTANLLILSETAMGACFFFIFFLLKAIKIQIKFVILQQHCVLRDILHVHRG